MRGASQGWITKKIEQRGQITGEVGLTPGRKRKKEDGLRER